MQSSINCKGVYKKDGMPAIKDVYHVIDFNVNLLNVSEMCGNFFDIVYKHYICQVKDKDGMVAMTD